MLQHTHTLSHHTSQLCINSIESGNPRLTLSVYHYPRIALGVVLLLLLYESFTFAVPDWSHIALSFHLRVSFLPKMYCVANDNLLAMWMDQDLSD